MENVKYNLLIGLNDKDLLKQVIETEQAKTIIINTLNNYGISALTIYNVNGVFTNEEGITTIEKSLKVEIINDTIDYKTMLNIVEVLKVALNQESIGLEVQTINIRWC
jgi:hypothetical protein